MNDPSPHENNPETSDLVSTVAQIRHDVAVIVNPSSDSGMRFFKQLFEVGRVENVWTPENTTE